MFYAEIDFWCFWGYSRHFCWFVLKNFEKKVHICFFLDESESKETLILSVTHVVEKVAEKVSLKGASSGYLKKKQVSG